MEGLLGESVVVSAEPRLLGWVFSGETEESDPVPVEVIDLSTGPFETRFPKLASRRKKRTPR